MNKLNYFIILFFVYGFCDAQNSNFKRTYHWYFGASAGIDFSNGTAVPDTNGHMIVSEGASSISDTAGNLLFYTDGRSVWNRIHQVMPNGMGLMAGTGSSTQAALIVPKPLSPNLYYIFTADELPGTNGMRYSEVDMNLDSGNGDITLLKNVLLFAPCTEKQASVNHCNDTNVWVIGHETNNNNFRAYLVTPNGINMNTVISSIGTPMIGNQSYGQLKFSPNGDMLATAMDIYLRRLELYAFDNMNGTLSNSLILSNADTGQYGVCFSPDNSKLYATRNNKLFQYNVSNYDSTLIVNSKVTVGNGNYFGILQNAPDNKIYLNHRTSDSSLSVINSPNAIGALCNFSLKSFYLGGKTATNGLCEVNESYFRQFQSVGCVTEISEIQDYYINVYPNPFCEKVVFETNGNLTFTLLFYDIFSRKIFDQSFKNSISINTEQLAKGIYLYEVRNKYSQISKGKLVKY